MTTIARVSCGLFAIVLSSAFALPARSQPGSYARSSWPEGHLYVLDTTGATVDRFRLSANGLPATTPDTILNLTGAKYPQGLAVDRAGHVFVADEEAGVVNEYAAGASGPQQPISTLNLSGDAPDFLKMDNSERLYVHYAGGNQNESIAIFSRGAHGTDPPMSIIPPYTDPPYLATDYVVSTSGALYVLDFSGPIAVYPAPLNSPSMPSAFMWPQKNGWEFDFSYTLAFDAAAQSLYIQFASRSQYGWNKTNFGVRALPGSGAELDPLIFNGQCGNLQWSRTSGAVIVKNYLMVSCLPSADVLVLRKDLLGKRRASELVGKGTLLGPAQIAVGP